MKKKLLIGLVALVVVIISGYFIYRATRPSPPGSASLTAGGITVSVSYSRPSVRGRVIFGTKEQQALQPYGVYWRLGANKATEITFSRDVMFNEQPVSAGTYRVYAIPGAQSFEIILNSELGKSGSEAPNPSLDVLHTQAPVTIPDTPVEKFTISMKAVAHSIHVNFEWSNVRFVIPVRER
jgi:hypothetical protein